MLKEDTTAEVATATASAVPRESRTLRVGIAGGGFMASVHARAAKAAGAEVVGAAGSRAERAEPARTATGAARGYADVAAMLDEADLDTLHICAPNALHFELAMAAAARGIHVVCEKPLTATAAQAQQLVAAARQAGIIGTVPFIYRFHPMAREMGHALRAGGAGTVGLVTGTYLQDWLAGTDSTNWRVDAASGGRSRAFADIGSHWFDLLEFVRGVRVARVSARFSTVFPDRGGRPVTTEDTCTVQFEMADGVIGTFAASQVAQGRKNRLALEVSGDVHSYAFDQESPESLWIGASDGNRVQLRDPDRLSAEAARYAVLPAGHAQGYQDCFNAFVSDTYAAIHGAAPSGLPRFEDGLRSARIVDGVIASAVDRGAWVDVPLEGEHA